MVRRGCTLFLPPSDVVARLGAADNSAGIAPAAAGEAVGFFRVGHTMQAVLVMFRADGERRSFSVTRDMTVIGRREDCDLRIPLGDVSRKHCRIVRDGEMLKIEDLGSSNGTYLNARRVQEALLSPGDSIQVGPVVFVLQVDGDPADDELNPVAMNVAA